MRIFYEEYEKMHFQLYKEDRIGNEKLAVIADEMKMVKRAAYQDLYIEGLIKDIDLDILKV